MASFISEVKCAGRLLQKVAIVTASTEGIGYGIAKRLVEEGARVVVSGPSQNNVDRAVKSLQEAGQDVTGVVCRNGKDEDRMGLIDQAVKRYGGLDIIVSSAAAKPFYGKILDCSESVWDETFEQNIKSAFMLVKESVPHMMERGGGSVVLVSANGGYTPNQNTAPHSVSKTALLGLTKALTPQLAEMNIRVNSVATGLATTRLSTNEFNSRQALDSHPRSASLNSVCRAETPAEIASAVAFLASDDARFITGEIIVAAEESLPDSRD